MPGIAGILGRGPVDTRGRELRTMLERMTHESSYVSGEVAWPELGLWAGWVAHPESFSTRVSRYRHSDGSTVMLSGECFRGPPNSTARPSMAGERFAVRVIEGVRREGPSYLRLLNGLFSGLLIDRTSGVCVLFNDRFGVERLYFGDVGGAVLFASEAKALLAVAPSMRAIDEVAAAEFIRLGSVLGNRTLFRGMQLVPGGSAWVCDASGSVARARYFESKEWEQQAPLEAGEFEDELSDAIVRAVPAYVGDGECIGFSVTGGLDTRMIAASLPPNVQDRLTAYTYAGHSGAPLDVTLGARVSATCGISHRVLRLSSEFFDGYAGLVDRTVYRTDGRAGPLDAHELYFSSLAANVAGIRLTGNYGSEVLRGMTTMKERDIRTTLLEPHMSALVNAVPTDARSAHPVTRAAFEEVPWHLGGPLASAKSLLTVRTPYLDNEIVRLAYRAPPGALEGPDTALRFVSRHSRRLAGIPTDQGRVATGGSRIGRVFSAGTAALMFKLDYWHKEGLPAYLVWGAPALELLSRIGVLGKHKYLAYRSWFRGCFKTYLQDVLTDPQTARDSMWSATALRQIAEEHVRGRRNCLHEIHAILSLEAIDRLLLRSEKDNVGRPSRPVM